MQPAIFLDKDGTLVEDVPYNVDCEQIRLVPDAGAALRLLRAEDYLLVIISNQSGVARGFFPIEAISAVEQRLSELLASEHVRLAGFYYCPHFEQGTVPEYSRDCDCRKPRPGLVLQAAQDLQIDLARSWLIGDILDDVEAGHQAGCRSILLDVGGETEWETDNPQRRPDYIALDLLDAAQHVSRSRRRVRTEEVAGHGA